MKAKNKLWDWCLRLEHHLCLTIVEWWTAGG